MLVVSSGEKNHACPMLYKRGSRACMHAASVGANHMPAPAVTAVWSWCMIRRLKTRVSFSSHGASGGPNTAIAKELSS
jgi:hypothetical protein